MTTENGVVFSKPLTLGAVAQLAKKEQYVATKVFPIVLAPSMKGTYKYFKKEDLEKYEVEMRQPGASYKNVTLDVKELAYVCQNYGLKHSLPIEHEEELGGNILQTGANYLYDQGLKTLEYQLATTYLVQGVFATEKTPTAKWNTPTGNPIDDVDQMKIDVRKAGHVTPEYAVMTEDVFEAIRKNENVLDRLAVDTLRIQRREDQIADILGLKAIFVVRESIGVTGMFLLFAKEEVAPLDNPNAGLIIIRNYAEDVMDAQGIGITNPYFDEDTDSKVLKLKLRFDMVTPAPSLGGLFYGCV